MAAYRLVPTDGGGAEIGEIRVVPYDEDAAPGAWSPKAMPAQGLPSELRAAVRTRDTLDAVRDIFEWKVGKWGGGHEPGQLEPEFVRTVVARLGFDLDSLTDVPHARQRTAERALAAAARTYVECCKEEPRRPTAALAERLYVSHSQASKILRQCRDRDILTGAGQGRAGGEITERARHLLGL